MSKTSVVLLVLACAFPARAGAEEHVVTQVDKQFSVERIELREGDSIVFRNADTVIHNVFSRDEDNPFEIKAQLPGQDTAIRFEKAGAVKVRCAIHPGMKLDVAVEPAGR